MQLSDDIKISFSVSTVFFKEVATVQYVSLAQIVSMIAELLLIPTWLDS